MLKKVFRLTFRCFLLLGIISLCACKQDPDPNPVSGSATTAESTEIDTNINEPTENTGEQEETPETTEQTTDITDNTGEQQEAPETTDAQLKSETPETTINTEEQPQTDEPPVRTILSDPDATVEDWLQAMPLQSGEEIAVLHTNMGDIKIRFFPTEAPKAVENFVTHAKNGYYDGIIFHRVINGFMIQGGDPTGTGAGGESIWGQDFGPEFSLKVRHFRGALSMAQTAQPNSIGSQFFIVQNNQLNGDQINQFINLKGRQDEFVKEVDGVPHYMNELMPASALDHYINHGGTPHLDLVNSKTGHTVFGHVLEGMAVVDAIAATPSTNDRPNEDVRIESITFEIVP